MASLQGKVSALLHRCILTDNSLPSIVSPQPKPKPTTSHRIPAGKLTALHRIPPDTSHCIPLGKLTAFHRLPPETQLMAFYRIPPGSSKCLAPLLLPLSQQSPIASFQTTGPSIASLQKPPFHCFSAAPFSELTAFHRIPPERPPIASFQPKPPFHCFSAAQTYLTAFHRIPAGTPFSELTAFHRIPPATCKCLAVPLLPLSQRPPIASLQPIGLPSHPFREVNGLPSHLSRQWQFNGLPSHPSRDPYVRCWAGTFSGLMAPHHIPPESKGFAALQYPHC
ncbi:hypothetical protein B0H14DRAFT_2621474 [Mycena olivaceomarginata]|nr:hypothetical protein B0H14DRAFT_2621474 [Mycena olivaceomarginata]